MWLASRCCSGVLRRQVAYAGHGWFKLLEALCAPSGRAATDTIWGPWRTGVLRRSPVCFASAA
eukprot:1458336-Alexandrium_andersonii.AAC.1